MRLVVGNAFGVESPVRTESETLYFEARLDAGSSIDLPAAEQLAIFLIDGEATVADEPLRQGELAILEDNAAGAVHATRDAHLVVCGGAALAGDRIVWWNFVNTSRDRIEKAKRDWREGRFPGVPGEEDFIPLPDS